MTSIRLAFGWLVPSKPTTSSDLSAGFRQLFDAARLRSEAQAMFEGWENFYLIVGPSAGALIGLMFVVVTLTAGRDSEQTERGKHLYTSPIVWHLAVVLVLSGAAVAPTIHPRLFGIVSAGLALLGLRWACAARSGSGGRNIPAPTACSTCGGTGSSPPWSMSGWAAPPSWSSPAAAGARARWRRR